MVKRVLVCPLDWGLGHATRCVPVIWELQRRGTEIFIASSGHALSFLRQEFPGLRFFELPSYKPVYPTKSSMLLKMTAQAPKFMRAIRNEHTVIASLVVDHKIDIVISDNRYGCWSTQAKSILITHQARLLMPAGFGWLAPLVNFIGYRHLRKFDEVWIPDQPDSGLTAPFLATRPLAHQYIGWLSRFKKRNNVAVKYEIIALISGPEPQRKILEILLTAQLKESGLKSLLVAGQPSHAYRRLDGCLEIVNHLSTSDLEEAILASTMVISRSGYSTVMDLMILGKKAIFVPTPQQPEQIFLADFLEKNNMAVKADQHSFSLDQAMIKSGTYKGLSGLMQEKDYLRAALDSILV